MLLFFFSQRREGREEGQREGREGRQREREFGGGGVRDGEITIRNYHTNIKISAQIGFVTDLSLMTNTATLSAAKQNTNNCGKTEYE